MNTRILASLLMIGVASAGVGYGTFAFFTDTATSVDNLFSAGTLALVLTDDDETDLDTVTASIGGADLAPGDSVSGSITLTNLGSIGGVILVDIDAVVSDNDASAMSEYLILTTFTYDGADLLASIADTDGRPGISLADFAADTLQGLPDPGAGGKILAMTVTFDTAADNDLQGDSTDLDLNFQLRQAGATPLA